MKKYYIRISGTRIPVPRRVYMDFHSAARREKYLKERDREHELLYYAALDKDRWQGDNILPNDEESVEDMALKSIMLTKLQEALDTLSPECKQLILLLYGDKSEVKVAEELNLPRTTLQSRKYAILAKLKKILGI